MKALLFLVLLPGLALAQDLAEKLQNLSVTVHASDGAQGSGVLITRDGKNYILTAAHVIDGGRKVLEFSDNATGLNKKFTKFEVCRVVREIIKEGRSIGKMSIEADVLAYSSADFGDDLALLKLRDPITIASVVFYSGTAIPSTGTKICHVGSFLGQDGSNSFSEGLISQVGRVLKEANDHVFDQSSATAFPGSSGGGMFNMNGEYVGTLVRGAGETFNLFVPIRRIKDWAKRHQVEFIFDEASKPDESKIVLEGLEPKQGSIGFGSTSTQQEISNQDRRTFLIRLAIASLLLVGCSSPSVYIDNGPGRRPFIIPESGSRLMQHSYVGPLTENDYPTGWGVGLIWVSAIGER